MYYLYRYIYQTLVGSYRYEQQIYYSCMSTSQLTSQQIYYSCMYNSYYIDRILLLASASTSSRDLDLQIVQLQQAPSFFWRYISGPTQKARMCMNLCETQSPLKIRPWSEKFVQDLQLQEVTRCMGSCSTQCMGRGPYILLYSMYGAARHGLCMGSYHSKCMEACTVSTDLHI